MAYRLEFTKPAQKDLAKLDKATLEAIRKRLEKLLEEAGELNHLALKGEFAGLYKLRVGKYRIIYDLQREALVVVVVRVGKRSDVYKGGL